MEIPSPLLPDASLAEYGEFRFQDEGRSIAMEIAVRRPSAPCPICGQEANRVHSYYSRSLADLPWADIPVRIELSVRRFHCDNAGCKRRIFCERVPTVAAAWARRTQRLAAAQTQIGLQAGGTGGARLCLALHMSAGIDALLALVRKLVIPNPAAPRILGVDDWAVRKGSTYGTVLVDLERGCIIDLLPDRTPETLAHWLRAHPGIEVISRDRAEAYADGIRQGAPDAIQVADRWHLLQNLAEALHKVFQQHHTVVEHSLTSPAPAPIQAAVTSGPTEVPSESVPLLRDTPQVPSAADQRRQKRVAAVQQLHDQGWSQLAIAAQLGLSNKTVRRYLNTPLPLVPQRRSRRGLLEPYKAYLIERWNGGCHNAAQLWREIVLQGFSGRMTTVRNFTLQLRQSCGIPPRTRSAAGHPLSGHPTRRPPTLRRLTWLLLRQPETLEDDEIEYLARVHAANPEVQTAVELAQEFSQMLRQRQVEKLDPWLEAAVDSGIKRFSQLATGLRRDDAAVRAALTLPWSNGPTEGHINRIKCVKRQMYGRAKLDLLGKRLLAT